MRFTVRSKPMKSASHTSSALSGTGHSADALAAHHLSNFERAKPVCSGQTHSEKLQLYAS